MSGWLPIDKDLLDDPRLLSLAMWFSGRYILAKHTAGEGTNDLKGTERMFAARYAVTGALVTLWRYADEHLRDDDSLPLTLVSLDALIGIEGFCEILPPEWLIERDDGCVILPGYCEKNSLITKRKRASQSKNRMAALRARRKSDAQRIHKLANNNTERSNGVTREHSENILRKTETETYTETNLELRGDARGEPRATRSAACRLPKEFELSGNRKACAIGEAINPASTFETSRIIRHQLAGPRRESTIGTRLGACSAGINRNEKPKRMSQKRPFCAVD